MEKFDDFEETMEKMALSYLDIEEVEDVFRSIFGEEYYEALEVDFDFDSEYDRYREF